MFAPGWQKLAGYRRTQKMPLILSLGAYVLIPDKNVVCARFSKIALKKVNKNLIKRVSRDNVSQTLSCLPPSICQNLFQKFCIKHLNQKLQTEETDTFHLELIHNQSGWVCVDVQAKILFLHMLEVYQSQLMLQELFCLFEKDKYLL